MGPHCLGSRRRPQEYYKNAQFLMLGWLIDAWQGACESVRPVVVPVERLAGEQARRDVDRSLGGIIEHT